MIGKISTQLLAVCTSYYRVLSRQFCNILPSTSFYDPMLNSVFKIQVRTIQQPEETQPSFEDPALRRRPGCLNGERRLASVERREQTRIHRDFDHIFAPNQF